MSDKLRELRQGFKIKSRSTLSVAGLHRCTFILNNDTVITKSGLDAGEAAEKCQNERQTLEHNATMEMRSK
jgi:hypothetical protein